MGHIEDNAKKLLPVDIRNIELHVKWYGVVGAIEHALEDMKACQTVYENGVHRCQTDSDAYKCSIAEIFYLLKDKNLSDTFVKNVLFKAQEIHEQNLAFEIQHPRIDYTSKNTAKIKHTKTKQKTIFTDEETGKIKPARREKSPKLKDLAKKFNLKLSFK